METEILGNTMTLLCSLILIVIGVIGVAIKSKKYKTK